MISGTLKSITLKIFITRTELLIDIDSTGWFKTSSIFSFSGQEEHLFGNWSFCSFWMFFTFAQSSTILFAQLITQILLLITLFVQLWVAKVGVEGCYRPLNMVWEDQLKQARNEMTSTWSLFVASSWGSCLNSSWCRNGLFLFSRESIKRAYDFIFAR